MLVYRQNNELTTPTAFVRSVPTGIILFPSYGPPQEPALIIVSNAVSGLLCTETKRTAICFLIFLINQTLCCQLKKTFSNKNRGSPNPASFSSAVGAVAVIKPAVLPVALQYRFRQWPTH